MRDPDHSALEDVAATIGVALTKERCHPLIWCQAQDPMGRRQLLRRVVFPTPGSPTVRNKIGRESTPVTMQTRSVGQQADWPSDPHQRHHHSPEGGRSGRLRPPQHTRRKGRTSIRPVLPMCGRQFSLGHA